MLLLSTLPRKSDDDHCPSCGFERRVTNVAQYSELDKAVEEVRKWCQVVVMIVPATWTCCETPGESSVQDPCHVKLILAPPITTNLIHPSKLLWPYNLSLIFRRIIYF